jgi:perosamine synthetase
MNNQTFVPVNEPLLTGNEKAYLNECIDSGWISSEGPFVTQFEQSFAHRCTRRHGISVCNGTAALDLAVTALGIGKGDEVILPTFTIISCVSQILRVGAIPVFVDCDPYTWNINVDQIEHLVTHRTKAIMVVHIYGLPTDMARVLQIASKYNLKVIEDAAEAHGLQYNEQICGSFGDISTFSFYPNKHITTGEGGMLLTDSDDLAEKCSSLRNLCFEPSQRFVHRELGWNMRMTNLQAAIGLAQLERLDEFLKLKRDNGLIYYNAITSLQALQLPVLETPYATNNFWVFGLVIRPEFNITAREAIHALGELGVGCRPFFFPLHRQPVLQHFGINIMYPCPVADYLSLKGFYIPSGLGLTTQQQDKVISALHTIFS